jgi:hypothetical protein
VKIYKYRRENGVWKYTTNQTATVANYDATRSRYSIRMSFSSRGSWRIKAYHQAHAGHPGLYSGDKNITVN